jgi:K+-transporting ATPase ATPase C chain
VKALPWVDLQARLRPPLVAFLALTALTGVAYPLLVGSLGHLAWPWQAEGSLIRREGRVVGSALIGQVFTAPGDFWGRPSATTTPDGQPLPCDAANSGGSNLSPGNPEFRKALKERIQALRAADPDARGPIPVDLVTASGSGLDPHLSPAAAAYQVRRVARARGLTQARVTALVQAHTQRPQLGLLGEARVNVLELNLALDALQTP